MAIAQMYIYKSFDGLGYLSYLSFFSSISFGNMGFSTSVCRKKPIHWGYPTIDIEFSCEGTTYITDVVSSGILSAKSEINIFNICTIDVNNEEEMNQHIGM